MQTPLDNLQTVLTSIIGCNDQVITSDTVIEELRLSSIQTVLFLAQIQDIYQFEIDFSDFYQCKTINNLIEVINNKLVVHV